MPKRTAKWRPRLLEQQGGKCHYCPVALTEATATLEHIVPRGFGGPASWYNLVVTCAECNQKRAHGLNLCPCKRCRRALDMFHRLRQGRPQAVQEYIYLGDRKEVWAAIAEFQRRRDRLWEHADNPKMSDETRLAARVAAKTWDQAIRLLGIPVAEPNSYLGDLRDISFPKLIAEGIAFYDAVTRPTAGPPAHRPPC